MCLWIHKKCIGEFKNRTEFQDFIHYYSAREWDCPICMSESLPFTLLDDDDFSMLLLDMNTKPAHLNTENIKKVYLKLKGQDFFNIRQDNDSQQDKYFDKIDPDINYFDNDSCDYIIDTDNIFFNHQKN